MQVFFWITENQAQLVTYGSAVSGADNWEVNGVIRHQECVILNS